MVRPTVSSLLATQNVEVPSVSPFPSGRREEKKEKYHKAQKTVRPKELEHHRHSLTLLVLKKRLHHYPEPRQVDEDLKGPSPSPAHPPPVARALRRDDVMGVSDQGRESDQGIAKHV